MDRAQLKALQAKWRKKLKDSGFEDAEDERGNLVTFHSAASKFKSIINTWPERQRYFELAGQLYWTFPWPNKRNKAIWKLHCAGLSNKAISRELGLGEDAVDNAVAKIAKYIKQ